VLRRSSWVLATAALCGLPPQIFLEPRTAALSCPVRRPLACVLDTPGQYHYFLLLLLLLLLTRPSASRGLSLSPPASCFGALSCVHLLFTNPRRPFPSSPFSPIITLTRLSTLLCVLFSGQDPSTTIDYEETSDRCGYCMPVCIISLRSSSFHVDLPHEPETTRPADDFIHPLNHVYQRLSPEAEVRHKDGPGLCHMPRSGHPGLRLRGKGARGGRPASRSSDDAVDIQ
jgi:hypothetical protein